MGSPNPKFENPEEFFDASDDFPFYDCIPTIQSNPSTSHTQSSSTDGLRRRRVPRREIPSPQNSKTLRFRKCVEENELKNELVELIKDEKIEESTITSVNEDNRVAESADDAMSLPLTSSSGFLVCLADLVVKAIGFQVNLLIALVSFPVLVLSYFYVLCIDPFGVLRLLLRHFKRKVSKMRDFALERVGYGFPIAKLALRFGVGAFWSVYVLVVLGGLFVLSLLFGGFVMRFLVEEPVRVKEVLNFDFTESSPVAYVPMGSCVGAAGDGSSCKEKSELGKVLVPRAIPLNYKTQVTVSLILPESEYNRNLGIFQVKVDFLSSCGTTLASSSYPCMLKFKSEPVRLLRTLFQAVPLVAGYVSESQIIKVNFKGFTEGDVPTSCLRVILQQRAEFRPGGGIPEIYDASLVIESELPLLRRIIWSWRKTIFIWVSMTSFMIELIFTLLCCRPIIIPSVRLRNDFASTNVNENSHL